MKELSSALLIEHYGGRYQLKNTTEIIKSEPVFAQFLQRSISREVKARLIAEEIGEVEHVLAVILFGSVAKGKATEESDIDLLIVTQGGLEEQLNSLVYSLMFKCDVPVEAAFQTLDEFIINLQAATASAFGLLEGYKVLYDRVEVQGVITLQAERAPDELGV